MNGAYDKHRFAWRSEPDDARWAFVFFTWFCIQAASGLLCYCLTLNQHNRTEMWPICDRDRLDYARLHSGTIYTEQNKTSRDNKFKKYFANPTDRGQSMSVRVRNVGCRWFLLLLMVVVTVAGSDFSHSPHQWSTPCLSCASKFRFL